MKKKMLMIISALVFGITGMFANGMELSAQETSNVEKDYSYLLTGDAIIGQMEQNSKGAYLSSGTSVIKDAGTGKIAAGGITQAAQKCNVTVDVIVERLTSGSWARVTSWTAKESNAWSVGTDKTLSVGRGYYYRVRCLHSAHTDASSSMTSSLWR